MIGFDQPLANDFLAVNQFAVIEGRNARRADIVLFVNGLPFVVFEIKSAIREDATPRAAFAQVRTYQAEIPSLFASNALLVVSDGLEARIGPLGAGGEWFKEWRPWGNDRGRERRSGLEAVIGGLLDPGVFLALLRDFIVFEDGGGGHIVKKIAGYHQFHAVQVAVEETLWAAGLARSPPTDGSHSGRFGDRRIGVVRHTQGSGKSLTMAFYAGRIVREPAMGNPTIVVLTDRSDLDDQLFATFARCRELLGQPPVQAESRAHLRELLSCESGGVLFNTIQKFLPDERGDRHPVLSERRNIVVIADEAHRSQYDFIDGFARHMRDALPHASFIGFTGTPIEFEDANTRAVFGDYISIYDIQRAVEDGATVPIYYESRLAKIELDKAERPRIDPDFEEATEGEEVERKERLKTKWAQLEAIVGAEKRLGLIARDIVDHFEKRLEVLKGKALIVSTSWRICVELYDQIVRLRPDWHANEDEKDVLRSL